MYVSVVYGYTSNQLNEIANQRADTAVLKPIVRELVIIVSRQKLKHRPWLIDMG